MGKLIQLDVVCCLALFRSQAILVFKAIKICVRGYSVTARILIIYSRLRSISILLKLLFSGFNSGVLNCSLYSALKGGILLSLSSGI